MTSYEVNANGNRSYSSSIPSKVASVAATWLKAGHEPKAYAIHSGERISVEEVTVSTARETAKRLAAA